MKDNNFFFAGGSDFEEWLCKIIKDAINKFHLEHNIPYPSSDNPDGNKLLNRTEAAAYCKICTRTLITRVHQGKLKNGGTGKKYLFRISDLDAFMFNEKK